MAGKLCIRKEIATGKSYVVTRNITYTQLNMITLSCSAKYVGINFDIATVIANPL